MTVTESCQKLLDRTCKYLRSTLLSEKFGLAVDQLTRDYMDMVGEHIPYQQLNFLSLESFLLSVPNVCRITGKGRDLHVVGVASNATSHIEDMVRKQNSKGGKKRGNGGKQKQSLYPNSLKPQPGVSRGFSNGVDKGNNKYKDNYRTSNGSWDHNRGSYSHNGQTSNGYSNVWGIKSYQWSQNTGDGTDKINETSYINGYRSKTNAGNFPISSKQNVWYTSSNADRKPSITKYYSQQNGCCSSINGKSNSIGFDSQQNGWVGIHSSGNKVVKTKNGFVDDIGFGGNISNNVWEGNSYIGNKPSTRNNGPVKNSRKTDNSKQNRFSTTYGKSTTSTIFTPTPPILPITALSTTMAGFSTVNMKISPPPPANSYLGQGWNQPRHLYQPMCPSSVVKKAPRIRLNL